jgi:hypothetical protein
MHTDPDLLALLALGEDVATADELDHLAACPECATRRASLTAAATAGRSATASGSLVRPSDRVWENITAELGLATTTAEAGAGQQPPGASGNGPVAGTGAVPAAAPPDVPAAAPADVPAAPADVPAAAPADVPAAPADMPAAAPADPPVAAPIDLAARRSVRAQGSPARRWVPWLAAAAVVVVGGGIAASIALRGAEPAPTPPPAAVLAEASLVALPDWPDASGGAVVRESEGHRTIEISVTSDVPDDAYREVWLISSDLTKLVSVGLLPGDEGSFAIPAGIDLGEYPVVDVSAEPLDGNPGHSSDSIVRGALTS